MAGNTATLTAVNTAWKARTGAPKGGVASFNSNGSATVFNIPHTLGAVPSIYSAIPVSEKSWAKHTVTADATNVIVTFATAPATQTNGVKLSWTAQLLR